MPGDEECDFPNCWEIEECGREPGGKNVADKGICVAASEKMGHSCWAIAGTLCKGKVQGTVAQKIGFCTNCEVHMLYNRSQGKRGREVAEKCPEEEERYIEMMIKLSGIV